MPHKDMNPHPRILYFGYHSDAQMLCAKLAGMRRYAAARGWDVEPVTRKESTPEALPGILARSRPAGCIVECHFGNTALKPSLFKGVPVVYVTPAHGLFGRGVARVMPDDDAIAREAMRELAANHPKAYAYVGFDQLASWDGVRLNAFRKLARRSKLPCGEFHYILHDKEDKAERAARAAALSAWLLTLPRGCGIMAANDRIAAETLSSARAAHLSCPYDFTLIGVDNSEAYSGTDDASISTIRVDYERMGYVAAKMIGEMTGTLRAAATTGAPQPVLVGPLLVLRRKSTGGSGRRAPFIIEAVEIIRREACDGLEPHDLIARFPFSRRLFETRFREAMGHSIREEIRQVRLERVCSLLAETDMPVSAISDFCGFGCGHALRELFHDRLGMSMREFRASRCR